MLGGEKLNLKVKIGKTKCVVVTKTGIGGSDTLACGDIIFNCTNQLKYNYDVNYDDCH